MLDDPSRVKSITNSKSFQYQFVHFRSYLENPYEYEQAQNYLKQMEIESMNFMES